jgi:hypothetical protein
VCVAHSRIGPGSPDSAAGTPASKLCSPRESVLATTRPWPGMVGRLGRCSPGPFPSKACSGIPRVRSSRGRTWSGASPCPVRPRELAAWPLVFARLELRPWGLEPTVRQRERSIKPPHATVGQRPCLRALSRSARPPVASLAFPQPRRRTVRPPRSPRCETCCPRPLSAAPRAIPRPCPRAAATRARRARVDLGGARFRSASRSTPSGAGQLFWSFAPRRTRWRVRAESALGLDALRTLRPYERFTSGSTLRHRNAAPLLAPFHTTRPPPAFTGAAPCGAFRSPVRPTCAVRPVPSVVFVSVAELGTAPRSTP